MENLTTIKELYVKDAFPNSLGITVEEVDAGYARVSMDLKENMLNFHGIGHGGAVFTLADTALGLASNSHGIPAVALTVNINFLAPARPGMTLVATAKEVHLTRSTGVYDITITTAAGEPIATARGTVYRKSRQTEAKNEQA